MLQLVYYVCGTELKRTPSDFLWKIWSRQFDSSQKCRSSSSVSLQTSKTNFSELVKFLRADLKSCSIFLLFTNLQTCVIRVHLSAFSFYFKSGPIIRWLKNFFRNKKNSFLKKLRYHQIFLICFLESATSLHNLWRKFVRP